MQTGSGSPHHVSQNPRFDRSRFFSLPASRIGRWAVGLVLVFILMFAFNAAVLMQLQGGFFGSSVLLPLFGIIMLACGLGAGITASLALLRHGERSWLVWLAVLPMLWVLFMLVGEFVFPH